ncbi:unnamed protein product [Linum tenue]|uniref:Uncharacterized protein n=1 Tax=Linum tenue TaxID=586396 RepID=A0AAV0QSG8_9ROSI|nr:unnamed protein product [Linum tenue]
MSDPYERVKGGRLSFKGGEVAVSSKAIAKRKKKKKSKLYDGDVAQPLEGEVTAGDGDASGEVYTIDAARKKKYDDLFPVEAKKFGYDPKAKEKNVEDALDDRVKKKADRYCK